MSRTLSLTITGITEVAIDDTNEISKILIGADLRVHQSIDLRIYIRETFKRHVGKPSHNLSSLSDNLVRLRLGFALLLNIRSKLCLLLNDKGYSTFKLFIAHVEDLPPNLQHGLAKEVTVGQTSNPTPGITRRDEPPH